MIYFYVFSDKIGVCDMISSNCRFRFKDVLDIFRNL